MEPPADTPIPTAAGPTPAEVLRRVAGADGGPWFPSEYARETGVDRDSLNDPLNDLRNAGLVIVLDWVKGKGQGYGVTPDGTKAAADPAALARALAFNRPPPPPADVPVAHPELPPAKTRDPGGLTTFDRGELARQALFDPPPPIVTPILIFANLIWFAVGFVVAWRTGGSLLVYLRGWENNVLVRTGGVYGETLLYGEWWRLASACFVHAGGLHLLLNLYALGVIGPVAEGLWGRWRFAVIYAWSGFAGSCLAMAVHPDSLVVGASGAVWGVMAAVLAWLVLNREYLPPEVVLDWLRSLGLVLVVNIAVSFAPKVSLEAHLGGAAVGFAAAVLANVARPGLVRRRVFLPASVALGLIPLGCLFGLAVYMEASGAWQPIRERAVARLLRPIAYDEVQSAYTESGIAAVTGKPPKRLADRVAKLHADAETAATGLSQIGFRPAAEYAAAVADLTAALAAPAGEWRPVAEKKKLVDRKWAELLKR